MTPPVAMRVPPLATKERPKAKEERYQEKERIKLAGKASGLKVFVIVAESGATGGRNVGPRRTLRSISHGKEKQRRQSKRIA